MKADKVFDCVIVCLLHTWGSCWQHVCYQSHICSILIWSESCLCFCTAQEVKHSLRCLQVMWSRGGRNVVKVLIWQGENIPTQVKALHWELSEVKEWAQSTDSERHVAVSCFLLMFLYESSCCINVSLSCRTCWTPLHPVGWVNVQTCIMWLSCKNHVSLKVRKLLLLFTNT